MKISDMSNEKYAGLGPGHVGDEKLLSYVGIKINDYQEPY